MNDIIDIKDNDMLNSLSKEEQAVAFSILQSMSSGDNSQYNKIKYADYSEIPVDIDTFLDDDNYMGRAWKDSNGNTKVYDTWRETARKLFPDNITTSVNNVLESGARGLGKSECACGVIGAYLVYRVMCLKNPLQFFGLKPTEKICFAFMNITKKLAEEIAIDKFQKSIQLSPWFMARGKMTSYNNKPYWIPPEPLKLIIGSQSSDVIGQPIFFAFFDEISFIKNQDIDKQKAKAIDMIDTAIGGMKTRFIQKGYDPTVLVLASSKRSEKSFMETHMRQKLESEPDNVIIVDKPVWEVKPKGTYSDSMFKVALGNKYLESQILPDDDVNVDPWIEKGYKILEVPEDFRANFMDDIDRALCDYAGISSSELSKYISGTVVKDCVDETLTNPFSSDVLEIGNAPDDKLQYYNFFDFEKIPKRLLSKPLCIHLDMSISGDMTGIAGTFIEGKKPSVDNNQSKDLYYTLGFSVSIKAPKGRQISFEKNRNFVRWLKEKGLNIREVTSDTFQSYDLIQQLQAEGFNCSILSVDRVDTDRICKPYQSLKSALYEGRIKMFKSSRLIDELTDLERNLNTGKIDHPPNCLTGDTKIRLLDGRELQIVDLLDEFNKGKKNYVYSINLESKKIEPKIIKNIWCSGNTAKIYKITLDNGEVIKCTPEHPFMLRDGTFINAEDLLPNDSLMPLYTRISDKGLSGYRMYYEPFEDKWHYEHRQFATELLDEKYLVHHKDCNKLNNNPDNLIWMSKESHINIHSNTGTGAFSEDALLKKSISLSEWHGKMRGTPEYEARSKKTSDSLLDFYGPDTKAAKHREYVEKIEKENAINYEDLSTSERRSLASRSQSSETRKLHNEAVSKAHSNGKYVNADNALKNYNDKIKFLKTLYPVIDKIKFFELFGFEYDSLSSTKKPVWSNRYRVKLHAILNHKVVKVECEYVENMPVYDLEIEDNHNFALSSGIFVHNSHKDAADAFCGSMFTCSKYAEEFAYNYGENYSTVIGVNLEVDETAEELNREFENELKDLHRPILNDEDYARNGMFAPTSFGSNDNIIII